ncbi:MAG: DUF4923 family protein [Muribaculaceae bacterium]|nr:DUF4923 family protein [Muribaculaceae bacterium]
MNKLIKLFMLMMVVSLPVMFTSCGDDDNDDDIPPVDTPIVGTWGASVTDEDGTVFLTYTFRNTGMFTAQFNDESDSFEEVSKQVINGSYTYTQSANHLTMRGNYTGGGSFGLTVKCVIEGNTMTWTEDDGTVTVFTK